jgi:hypothetical protein
MATIVNNIRFSDNAKELAANLQAGIGTLDVMKSSVDRTVQSLGGTGLYGAANKITAAIQELGGVTKLTSAEQERALGTLDKAIEKYSAMGKVAPQALTDTAAALHEVTSATDKAADSSGGFFNGMVAHIAEGMLVRDAIREIIGVVKELIVALPEMALKGAAVADVEENFQHLTEQLGRTSETLTGALRDGTHGTISDFELMKLASKDLTAGLTLTDDQFGTLAKGAFALAQATGVDVKQALDTMNDAMLTGRTKALALLTGKIDVTAAEEKFAASLGKTADQLTENGKLEANRAAILDAVSAATARLGVQTDGLDERVAQAHVAWENFTEDLGKTIATSPVVMAGMDGIRDALIDAFGGKQQNLIQSIAKALDEIVIHVVDVGLASVEAARVVHVAWEAVNTVFNVGALAIVGAITGIGEGMLALTRLGATLHLIPKSEIDDVLKTQQYLRDLTVDIANNTVESAKGTVGMSEFDKSLDAAGGTLFGIRDKMVAASDAAEKQRGVTAALGAAHTTTAGAVKQHGDALVKAGKQAEEAGNLFGGQTTINETVETSFQDLTFKVDNYGTHVEQMTTSARDYLHNHRDDVQAAADGWDDLASHSIAYNTAQLETATGAQKLYTAISTLPNVTSSLTQKTDQESDAFAGLSKNLSGLSSEFAKLAQISGGSFGGIVKDVGTMIAEFSVLSKSIDQFKNSQASMTSDGKTDYAGMATSIVSMGSSAVGTFEGIHNGTVSVGAGMVSMAAKGAAIGSIIPGIGTAIGGVIGGVAGLVAGLTRGVSQAEKDGRALEAQFEQTYGGFQGMIDKVGEVYAATGRSSQQAQADIAALMAAEKQGAAATQAAIDTINVAFTEQKAKAADVSTAVDGILAAAKATGGSFPASMQPALDQLLTMNGLTDDEKKALQGLADTGKPSFDDLSTAAGHYGLSLDEVGGKVPQLSITHQADQIAKDYDELVTQSGADSDKVLAGMKDSLNQLVQHAMDTGSVLPTSLQPMIDQLLKTGQLTDTAGNKIDSLGDLKFDDTGDPLAKSLTTLTDALNHLGQILSGLPSQASSAASGISQGLSQIQAPSFEIHYSYVADNSPDISMASTGGEVTRYGIQHFFRGGLVQHLAAGGMVAGLGLGAIAWPTQGTDVVPAMLTPHERVLTVEQNQAYEQLLHAPDAPAVSGLGAPSTADTSNGAGAQAEIAKLRNDMARRDLDMPRNFARAVRDLGPDVRRR